MNKKENLTNDKNTIKTIISINTNASESKKNAKMIFCLFMI